MCLLLILEEGVSDGEYYPPGSPATSRVLHQLVKHLCYPPSGKARVSLLCMHSHRRKREVPCELAGAAYIYPTAG